MRSTASRGSASDAGGSGLIMMIQPASGPGVCDRARWRICAKPAVVIRPTRAPFDSSTAFVATVVPCRMFRTPPGSIPASSQMRRTPVSTPCDGSAGVDGVLTRNCAPPFEWSTRQRSVKVAPASTPSLYAMPLSLARSARDRRERAGPVDHALELSPEHSFQPLRDLDQPPEVDPGLDSFPVEEVDEVLRADVPGRARRERAAAD